MNFLLPIYIWFISRLLRRHRGAFFLDVGAGAGLYALAVAGMEERPEVFAFDSSGTLSCFRVSILPTIWPEVIG